MVKADKKEKRIINLFIQVCGLLTIFLGCSAILGWIFGVPELASFASGKIPMALSSAVLFVAFGFIIFFHHRIISNSIMFRVGVVISYSGILVAVLLLSLAMIGIHPDSGHIGLKMSRAVEGLIVGQMSPVTAFCFVFVGLSFLIILTKPGQKKLIKTSLIFAVIAFFISIILLLSYLLGTPLLYEGSFIPPALTTSLAFLFLSIALLLISGLKVWTYDELSNALSTRYTYSLVLVFVILILSVMTTGYSYYKNYEKQYRLGIEQDLSSIASLKVNQIVQWRKERLNNAEFLYKNTEFSGLVNSLLKNQNDIDVKKRIREWIDKVHSTYQYESISLHDLKGRELVASPIKKMHSHLFFPKLLSEIQKSEEIIFKDFYRDENDLRIYLAIFIPIQFDNNLIGILDLRLDPQQYLYPLINEWPTPSKTAETLIVRREGKEVVFLNELKFKKNTALNLRRPLTELNLTSVQAALGKKGIIQGVDYRGVPVLAYVCPIPNSPWFLVTRIDVAEVYVHLQEWFWAIIILVVVLLTGLGTSIGLIWRNQRSKFYLERYQSTEKIRKLNRVYAVLSDINGAIVRIRNSQELFEKACDIAIEKGGFQMAWIGKINLQTMKVNVVASKGISEVRLKKLDFNYDDESLLRMAGRAIKSGVHVISNDIQNDGSILPLDKDSVMYDTKSSAAFPLKAFGQVWGVFKLYSSEVGFFDEEELKLLDELAMDISFSIEFAEKEAESKQAGDKLIASEVRYRRLFESAKDGILILDAETGKIVDVNPFLIDLLGYSKEKFIEKEIWEIGFFKDIVANYDKFLELQKNKYVRYENLPLETSNGRKINVEFVSNVYLVDNQKVIQCNIRDVTERKRSEEALQQERDFSRTIIQTSPTFFIAIGSDGKTIMMNNSMLKTIGYTLSEVVGMDYLANFVPVEDREMLSKIFEALLTTNESTMNENSILTKDGRKIIVEWHGKNILKPNGETKYFFALGIDITDRKLAEKTIRESEKKYRSIFENIQDVYYETSLDGIVLEVSPSVEVLTKNKVKREDVIGKSMYDFYLDSNERDALIKELLNRKSLVDYEVQLKNIDGTVVPCSISSKIQFNSDGKPEKIIGTMHDITERKLAEKELLKLSRAVEQSPVSVIITDTKGNIEYINPKLTEVTGYQLTEILGKNPRIFASGEKPKSEYKIIWDTITSGKEWRGEFLNKKKNGELYWEFASISAIVNEKGETTHYLAVKEDVTERKLAEKEITMLAHSLKSINECVSITDMEDKIIFINESFLKTYGYNENELVGKHISIVRSPKNPPELVNEILQSTIRGGWQGELWNRRKDGSEFLIYLSTTMIKGKDSSSIGLIGVAKDITEFKQAEAALRKKEYMLSQSQSLAHIGSWG
ncbi:MAG: PAS domain S-box protein, partial [Melioribacteraceae bacterium]